MVFNKMLRAFAVGVVLLAICVAYLNSAAATDHRAQTAQKKRAAPTLPASGSPSEARPSSRSLVELVSISKLDRNLVLTNVIKSLREYVPALLPDWKTAIRVAANTSRAEPREPLVSRE